MAATVDGQEVRVLAISTAKRVEEEIGGSKCVEICGANLVAGGGSGGKEPPSATAHPQESTQVSL